MRHPFQIAAVALALIVAVTASAMAGADVYAKPGFHTEMEDGRLWVFRADSAELAEFEAHGELAKHVVRPGRGPGGITIKGPDGDTIDAYMKAE